MDPVVEQLVTAVNSLTSLFETLQERYPDVVKQVSEEIKKQEQVRTILKEHNLPEDLALFYDGSRYSVDEVRELVNTFDEDEVGVLMVHGVALSEAKVWKEAGFKLDMEGVGWLSTFPTPEEAKPWKEAGFAPFEAVEYHLVTESVEEAIEWKNRGFSPKQVREYKEAHKGEDAPKNEEN